MQQFYLYNLCFCSSERVVVATRAGKQPHCLLWRRKKSSRRAPICSGLQSVVWEGPQSRYILNQTNAQQLWCRTITRFSLSQLRKASPSVGVTSRGRRSLLQFPASPMLRNKVLSHNMLSVFCFIDLWSGWSIPKPWQCSQESLWCPFTQWFWLES